MKTIVQHQPRLLAVLLLAATIGFVLLVHLVSPHHAEADKTVGLLKLI